MRAVVVGAGFAGLAAARALSGHGHEVVLVERHNFHTFQALLYQVATAGLSADDVAFPVRGIFHDHPDVHVRQGEVVGIDLERSCLRLDGDPEPLAYDALVLAPGSRPGFFGVPGAEEHALPLKELADALALRNAVLARFEAADRPGDAGHRREGDLTFVVVGGGPTGVELSGALGELFTHVLTKDFPHLAVDEARVVLLEATDRVLGGYPPAACEHAREALAARGVEVRLATAVAEVTPDAVRLVGGEVVPTRTVVWTAGVRPSPLADGLAVEKDRSGRVVVGPDLGLSGHAGVFVAGDLAAAPAPGGGVHPQLAPVAIQGGDAAGRAAAAHLAGLPTEAFRYVDRGTMATIGRGAAVAELPFGISLRGRAAWVAWLVQHLLRIIGFRNRASVLVAWTWNLLTWERGPRLIVSFPPPPSPGS